MTTAGLCACGFGAASTAPRCRACPMSGPGAQAARAVTPESLDATPLMTYSRWKKSSNTFGPTGRVVATLLLLVPLPLLAMAIGVGIGIIGAGIYILVIMPLALRDIWKRAAFPVQAPTPAATSQPTRFS